MLFLFLINNIGYVGVYALLRWDIVHEVSELIERNEPQKYTEIVLPEEVVNSTNRDFIRLNHHEFRYKHKMYDIVRQERVGDTIHFIVFHDRKDEVNFDHLAANNSIWVRNPGDEASPKTAVLTVMVKNLFSPLFPDKHKKKIMAMSLFHIMSFYSPGFPEEPACRVPVPPPKLI